MLEFVLCYDSEDHKYGNEKENDLTSRKWIYNDLRE